MSKNKTQKTDAGVDAFVDSVADERARRDCRTLVDVMRRVTGEPPKMWGASIVGFGAYHYRYDSGREGDWFLTGFSPRKQALTLYLMPGCAWPEELMAKLGKHKTGKGCLYVKSLDDVDLPTLEQLLARSVAGLRKMYPAK